MKKIILNLSAQLDEKLNHNEKADSETINNNPTSNGSTISLAPGDGVMLQHGFLSIEWFVVLT